MKHDQLQMEILRRTALDAARRLREQAGRLRKEAGGLEAQADRLEQEAGMTRPSNTPN